MEREHMGGPSTGVREHEDASLRDDDEHPYVDGYSALFYEG